MKNKYISIALLIAILYWYLESVVEYSVHQLGDVVLIPENTYELGIRLLVFLLIISFGYLVEINIKRFIKSENKLKRLNEKFNKAQQISKTGSWSLDLKNNHLTWSNEIFNLFEIHQSKFKASYETFIDAIHPDDRERVDNAYKNSLITKQPYEIDHRLKFPDGRIKHVREACDTSYDEEGNPVVSIGTVQDITNQVQTNEKMQLYAKVLLESSEAILVTDSQNNIITVNPALIKLSGYSEIELIGKNPRVLSSDKTSPETYQAMWQSIKINGYWEGELIDKRKDGTEYPKWLSISAIKDSKGNISNYIGIFKDISERKASEEKIQFLAHNDHLTGLYNRYSLEERLGQAINQAKRNRKRIAVLFVDMDRFKKINDSIGHQAGDAVIKQIAQRLKFTVRRESDVIARIGGDEFVIVLTEIENSTAAALISMTLIHMLDQSYNYNNHELFSSASIGISMYPSDGDNSSELIKNADIAMYHAKTAGRNNYQFFDTSINEKAKESIELENDLRNAIENNQLELHYQPQIKAITNEIIGVEALLRWKHPAKGYVSPERFIEIAEQSGQIHSIGKWVLNQVCVDIVKQNKSKNKILRVAINVSVEQLRSEDFVADIEEFLNKYNVPGNQIEVEITESIAMNDPEDTVEKLTSLKKLGISTSIDDFGTGYSSLAYLKLLPVDTLKLDRAFVENIEIDENDQAICDATISMAHSLGKAVVAEGVETQEQQDYLISKGCDFLQGYLISKPLPIELLNEYLSKLKH